MSPSRSELLLAARQFCEDFSNKKDIATLIFHFSTTQQATAIEHGEPALAPFLGRPFVGLIGVQKYFETVASLLSYENMRFSEFVVDTEPRKVAVTGRARFKWMSTGECWDETFSYILDFDEEHKIVVYQVWADSGAAYLASKGKLDETRKKKESAQ